MSFLPINRTIFGIETHAFVELFEQLNLSIAPSLELKREIPSATLRRK